MEACNRLVGDEKSNEVKLVKNYKMSVKCFALEDLATKLGITAQMTQTKRHISNMAANTSKPIVSPVTESSSLMDIIVHRPQYNSQAIVQPSPDVLKILENIPAGVLNNPLSSMGPSVSSPMPTPPLKRR